jgi:hypothetical protein
MVCGLIIEYRNMASILHEFGATLRTYVDCQNGNFQSEDMKMYNSLISLNQLNIIHMYFAWSYHQTPAGGSQDFILT